jgi:hypothetical protein
MSDRKSPPSDRSRSSAPVPLTPGGRPMSTYALRGDSETEFTPEELERIVDQVWEYGRVIPDADASVWRQDACGAWIMRDHFGRFDSEFGWKIEKVAPAPEHKTGLLRPFNWRNDYDATSGRTQCGSVAERPAGPPHNKQS